MDFQGKWIRTSEEIGDICPVFRKSWTQEKKIEKAELYLTALGIYEAKLNGKRISEDVLTPGWTSYEKRLQYQKYDITELTERENALTVTVGKGWFSSPMPGWVESEDKKRRAARKRGIIGEIHLSYEDGSGEVLPTDGSWTWGESQVRFSEIYDGETYDAGFVTEQWRQAKEFEWPKKILISQEGEPVRERERIEIKEILHTPAGETVIDFGQEITGYVEIRLTAKAGDVVHVLHGEVLDKDGNFYNENYRGAKAELTYICKEGEQSWHPSLTFFGFRYLKVDKFPGNVGPENFTAIVVCSDIRRTGMLRCSDSEINQLFSNIFWGQKGNFVDVPTDCPQRDERLGWTGDAQVFVKAASYNYDVEKFFRKWLRDLAADQRADGSVGQVIPDYLPEGAPSAAWGDAAVICPWQIYLTYGNKEVLEEQFESMKRWLDYITGTTKTQYLWTGGEHFGDWLGLDAPSGSYKGSSRDDFIASAFYAHSAELVVKAGKVLGRDVSGYETLLKNIIKTFRSTYPDCRTQTEYILSIQFGLAEHPQESADKLAEMIIRDGERIQTGFVGTPYILHVLSEYGHNDLAYTLFLRKEYPSWLYSVRKGATTIWEHWDGIMENGEFWDTAMNSFNHYAYGSVADWVYEKAAGIRLPEEAPGFAAVKFQPMPDERMEWMEASIETRHGKISSGWRHTEGRIRYEICTPVAATVVIGGQEKKILPGSYVFWE